MNCLSLDLSKRLNASLSVLEEKDARIDELENDLKEARGSAVGLYGSSKEYLENENLKMSIRIEDLEETVKTLKSQLRDQKPHLNSKRSEPSEKPQANDQRNGNPERSPSFSRKNRRREPSERTLQSPSKQTRMSEYDLDDVSKCNHQCIVFYKSLSSFASRQKWNFYHMQMKSSLLHKICPQCMVSI